MVVVDPLGAVGDGGKADMEHNMLEQTPHEVAGRAMVLRDFPACSMLSTLPPSSSWARTAHYRHDTAKHLQL